MHRWHSELTGTFRNIMHQGFFTGLLKRILFRDAAKHRHLQRFWGQLHTVSIFGMNYGGGGVIETSGEVWVLANVVAENCRAIVSPIVFDVGANVGDYSLCVRRIIPGARVYAFEPARSTYQQLVAHLGNASDGADVKPYNVGFSDSEKSLELYSYTIAGQEISPLASIDQRLPTQVVDVRIGSNERIHVQTIDGFCEAEGIEHIHFLKLDVEGHELSVLRGARKMLESGGISMIQFEFGPANIYSRTYFYDFWTVLSDHYDIYRIIPGGIVPIGYYGEHREVFLTTNYVAVKK